MDLTLWVSSIVAFVRAGYPATGHTPVVALSRRRLCNDEITAIATKLMKRRLWPISSIDIGVEITRVTNEMPSPADVERVMHRLNVMRCARG
ncbi:MAG: DUF3349 domain-containing protein [Mycobacterium sp.]|uniref:DUF3349 domain-containing protein n=1 Tax=Mycobacterium sp. TaxID=1785 RepID=UPI001ED2249D|nr:DUF3349 domain-containing protein [Mycobacterium sp.]MBV8789410.1 DUF3349 domain-containing protein [Mycobacterium sp.]